MRARCTMWVVGLAALWLAGRQALEAQAAPGEPENLAPRARVSASDEYDNAFRAEERTPAAEKLAEELCSGRLGFRDLLVIQRHHLALSHVYTYHVEGYRPGGGLYVFTPGPDGGALRRLVDSAHGEIVDCDLSYDGREVVFSWKRGGQEMAQPHLLTEEVDRRDPDHNYQVYRINLDGSGLRRLTHLPSNNLNACWLPDGGIAFISDRKPAYAWIDLNVPYYGTSASNHRDRMGCRHLLPPELQPLLDEVARGRCAACHASGLPRTFYTRVLEPEKNGFLLAPLARSAGGTEACGRAVFASKNDPDYRRILAVFRPIQELVRASARADMAGFVEPSSDPARHPARGEGAGPR
ncbi:MAG: hypothetical protein HY721_07980 [Planctomycetes bacterium]|nr:hypothetical protein [Planctomycetota bacterium]